MSLQDFNFYQNSETHLMSWQARCNRLSTFSFRDFGWLEPLCTGQSFHSTAFKFWNVLGGQLFMTSTLNPLNSNKVSTNGLVQSKLVARTSQVYVVLSPVFENSINTKCSLSFQANFCWRTAGDAGVWKQQPHPTSHRCKCTIFKIPCCFSGNNIIQC